MISVLIFCVVTKPRELLIIQFANLSCEVDMTVSRNVLAPLPCITLIKQILKFLNNLRKILNTDFSNGKLWLLTFFDLLMALRLREVTNPLPDRPYEYFGYEDEIFILSRSPDFKEMSNMTYWSPLYISLRFLILRQPQFSMFTCVKFPSQNVFWVEKPW